MGSNGKEGRKGIFFPSILKSKQIDRQKRRFRAILKRSCKDPLFCLGVISAVLFVGLSFGASPILKPLSFERDFVFLASASADPAAAAFQDPVVRAVQSTAIKSPKEQPDLALIQKNSLAAVNPVPVISSQVLGSIFEDEAASSGRQEIFEYTVQQGDSLQSLAEEFNISANTIVWANNLAAKSKLKTGQRLVILPVSGVLHYVQKGNTIASIAKQHKGRPEEIIAFNNLSGDGDIFTGDILIVPNGVILPAPKSNISHFAEESGSLIPVAASYFICPLTSPCRITQGLHWYNAIDFDADCGDPIYAAAGGAIQKVKYGWNGGGGNYLTILHPNGIVTYYGHILKSLVSPGEQVSQGQQIALAGGQPGTKGAGISTGCHTHFEVRGGKNPFVK